MELRQLEYFIAAVEEKSFQKAGKKLYTSQPAVSKAIASLESDVGAKLFDRGSKGLTLTARGEKLYYHAKNILSQVALMQSPEPEEQERALTLASYPSLMIADNLTDFYNSNPQLETLDYREGNVQEIINLVDAGIVELGIVYISPNQSELLSHILSHKQLEFVPLLNSELCVYVGKEHPLYGKGAAIDTTALSKFSYIRGVSDFFSVEHHFDYVNLNAIDTAHFKDKVLTNSDHLVSCMLERTDLAYLGIHTKVRADEMKILLDTEEKILTLGYIKYKAAPLSEIASAFLTHLTQNVGQQI